MLEAAAEGVEEAVFEVAVNGGEIVVILALGVVVGEVRRLIFKAALVFIMEADEGGEMRSGSEVALVYELVAVGGELVLVWISLGVIEDGLAGCGIAVGAEDGDGKAEGVGGAVADAP